MDNTIYFLSGFIAALLGWYMVATSLIPMLPSYASISSYAPVAAKIDAIGETVPDEPCVYFVGGSNVFIGVSAKTFSEETGIPSYNYGVIITMGPDMVLHLLEDRLKPGDTVVMAWEYIMYPYQRSKDVFSTYWNLIFGPMSDVLEKLPPLDRFQLVLQLQETELLEGLFQLYTQASNEFPMPISQEGDAMFNKGLKIEDKKLAAPLPIMGQQLAPSADMEAAIKSFNEKAQAMGVRVLATWPNVYRHPGFEESLIAEQNIESIKAMWHRLGIHVVGEPEDAMFGKEYIYDDHYHLNTDGTKLRTKRLVAQILPFLETP